MEPVSHNVPSSNTHIYVLSLYSGTVVEHLSLQHQTGLKSGEGLGWGFSDTEIETEGLQSKVVLNEWWSLYQGFDCTLYQYASVQSLSWTQDEQNTQIDSATSTPPLEGLK